jgi:hypothetical protein
MFTRIPPINWQIPRKSFSPIFSSGKIKMMLNFVYSVSGQLTKEISQDVQSGRNTNVSVVFNRYSLETIATCAFGVKAGTWFTIN